MDSISVCLNQLKYVTGFELWTKQNQEGRTAKPKKKKDPGLRASEEVCCSPGTFSAYLALQSSVGLAVKIAEPTLIDIKDPICMGGIYVHRAALLNSSVCLCFPADFTY